MPGWEERVAFARFWRSKLLFSDLVEFPEDICKYVADITAGFSFAYMKELFVITLLTIARGTFTGEDPQDAAASYASNDTDNAKKHPIAVEIKSTDAQETTTEKTSVNDIPVVTAVVADQELVSQKIVKKIDIPAHLQDNVLLKVIQKEVRTLIAEMAETKEEDWPSERKHTGGGGIPVQRALRPMIRHMQGTPVFRP
jgi:hypothetical protein